MQSTNFQAIQKKNSVMPSNDRMRLSSTSLTAYWMPTADPSTLERAGISSAPSPRRKNIKNSVELVDCSFLTECIFALQSEIRKTYRLHLPSVARKASDASQRGDPCIAFIVRFPNSPMGSSASLRKHYRGAVSTG